MKKQIIELLNNNPLLSNINAIMAIAAMLGLDYQTAEQLYSENSKWK